MSAHTPGPWEVELVMRVPSVRAGPVRHYAQGSGRSQLVAIFPIEAGPNDTADAMEARRLADACLIAAAPDLLEALETILVACRTGMPEYSLVDVEEVARAAIAKARGTP